MTRNFSQLQQQIESTLAKLKAAKDPSLRLEALREMRRLLIEADGVLDHTRKSQSDPL